MQTITALQIDSSIGCAAAAAGMVSLGEQEAFECLSSRSAAPTHSKTQAETVSDKSRDAFFYYSNDEFRLNTLKGIEVTSAKTVPSQSERRTRLSFELDPFLIMEDVMCEEHDADKNGLGEIDCHDLKCDGHDSQMDLLASLLGTFSQEQEAFERSCSLSPASADTNDFTDTAPHKSNDAFLYYSNDETRLNTLKGIDVSNATTAPSQSERRTRLSFELDPFLIMEDFMDELRDADKHTQGDTDCDELEYSVDVSTMDCRELECAGDDSEIQSEMDLLAGLLIV